MAEDRNKTSDGAEVVDHYGASYGHFSSDLYAEIRRETYGEDIGQTGWLTAAEQDKFLSWLELTTESHVLDVACGSGGPSVRLVQRTGCRVHGIDVHEQGIANAAELARKEGVEERATFEVLDGARSLPFESEWFDAVVCIDAINHLPDRLAVLREWARVLKPKGRVLFTDPVVITGPLSNKEIATRSSVGFFLFVPPQADETLIQQAGLELLNCEDRTENMARMASRWRAAREARETELRQVEGEATYEGQQEFFRVAEIVATEKRLSRFVYLAQRPR